MKLQNFNFLVNVPSSHAWIRCAAFLLLALLNHGIIWYVVNFHFRHLTCCFQRKKNQISFEISNSSIHSFFCRQLFFRGLEPRIFQKPSNSKAIFEPQIKKLQATFLRNASFFKFSAKTSQKHKQLHSNFQPNFCPKQKQLEPRFLTKKLCSWIVHLSFKKETKQFHQPQRKWEHWSFHFYRG